MSTSQCKQGLFVLQAVILSRRTAAKKKDTTISQITSFVNAENA